MNSFRTLWSPNWIKAFERLTPHLAAVSRQFANKCDVLYNAKLTKGEFRFSGFRRNQARLLLNKLESFNGQPFGAVNALVKAGRLKGKVDTIRLSSGSALFEDKLGWYVYLGFCTGGAPPKEKPPPFHLIHEGIITLHLIRLGLHSTFTQLQKTIL